MKIAIIGAMKKEITFLLNKLENIKENKYSKFTFFEGSFSGNEIITVEAGIGKVASGILFSALVSQYPDIDLAINIGVSGGVINRVNIGDIVVANKLKYADVDATVIEEFVYGQVPNCPDQFTTKIDLIKNIINNINLNCQVGTILTGDQFFADKSKVENMINSYFKDDNVLCLDMESAALAQSAWFYGIDYLAIRAISDLIGKDFQFNEYLQNVEKACENSNIFLLEILKYIKK